MKRSIGLDLVDIARFRSHARQAESAFLKKVFSESERAYCLAFKDPAPHLAGFFAAKEAVSKALGTGRHPFSKIEIRHSKSGKPLAYQAGKKLRVEVSISHARGVAGAIALA